MTKSFKYVYPNLKIDRSINAFLFNIEVALVDVYIGYNEVSDNSCFLLFDASHEKLDKGLFELFIKSAYVKKHFPVGDIVTENLVLVEIENNITNLNQKFMDGKYSEMYTKDQIQFLFDYHQRKVLLKHDAYREVLEELLDVEIEPGSELEQKPDLSVELFVKEKELSCKT